jgi:hypothetical protein
MFLCTINGGVLYAFDDVYSGNVFIDSDFVVGAGAVFKPDALYISNSVNILNNGLFDTDIYLCDGCDVYIRNKGDFTASMNGGGRAYQLVVGRDDMNPIDIASEYFLLVQGGNHLLLDDIYGVAGTADKIIIRDSVIDLSAIDAPKNYVLELDGSIVLYQGGLVDIFSGPVLHNVTGDADIVLVTDIKNPLFVNVAYIDDDALYVRQVRETDYVKVLGTGIGDYLNDVRVEGSGDKLLGMLDSVTDMHALYDVMGMSARLNPDKLLESVRIIGAMDDFSMFFQSGGGVQASVITSNDFDAYDFSGVIGLKIGDVKFGVGARFGELYYLSDVDEFDGLYYGINLYADYVLHGDMFVRGLVGVNNFEFDIGDVFYRNQRINNPNVLLGNMLVDYGIKYRVWDHINVTPFVGVDMNFYRLGNICDFDFGMRTGIGVGYAYQMHAINYDYKMNVVLNTLGESGVQFDASFWSVYDNAGGNIGASILRAMGVTTYELTVGARIYF